MRGKSQKGAKGKEGLDVRGFRPFASAVVELVLATVPRLHYSEKQDGPREERDLGDRQEGCQGLA